MFHRQRSLFLLTLRQRYLLMTVLFWCAQYTYTAYLTPQLTAMQISARFVGSITGAYGLSQLLVRIPLGMYADHNGRHRPVILAGLIILIIPGLILRLSTDPRLILCARFLAGVAAGTWVSFTVFFQNMNRRETNQNMGTINAANSAGLLLAFLVSTLLVDRIGIEGLYLLSSLIAVAASGIFFLSRDMVPLDRPAEKKPTDLGRPSLTKALSLRALLASSAVMAFMQFLVYATAQNFSANVATEAGLPRPSLGMLSAVFTASGLLSQAYIAKRSGSVRSDRSLLVLGFLALGGHAFLLPHVAGFPAFIFLYALAGIGRGLISPLLMANAIRRCAPERRGTAMGIFQSLYSLGMFAGPQLMGVLIAAGEGSYSSAFQAVTVFAIVAALLSLLLPISAEVPDEAAART